MTDDATRISARRYWLGLLCLLVSVGAAAVLSGKQLDLFDAPGCGDGSPCDQAAASRWGVVPLLGWPVSFLGLAYFAGLAAAWTAAHLGPGATGAFRNAVRLGAALSILFVIAMIAGGYLCKYCIAAHAGNFAFLFVVELAPRAPGGTPRLAAWGAGVFVLVTAVTAGASVAAGEKVERQRGESRQQILEATREQAPRGEPFTGRYRLGPERAPIRIVIFSDYQCPDCQRIEREAMTLLETRDDVSLSAKHHPFCTDCNPHVRTNPHPNACWAARAAEAAGILRGNDGFWEMHRWLFERGGSFTDAEIHQRLRELGYDVAEFLRVMQGPETLELVQADIEEARSLGLHYTPMIFINGVELKGWNATAALSRTVREVAATNPPPGDATMDSPPPAREKFIADWAEQPLRNMPSDYRSWTLGPQEAAVRVVLWGDYQEPFTAEADGILRGLVASRGDTSYTFRHFPINRACNPVAQQTFHEMACLAHQAAEAAGEVDGHHGYWLMHEWLMTHQEGFGESALRDAAETLGLDVEWLFEELGSATIRAAIAEDAREGRRMGLRGVPFIFVNGKRVPRWRMDGVLETILEAAARESAAGS